jgi:hypothetical protein
MIQGQVRFDARLWVIIAQEGMREIKAFAMVSRTGATGPRMSRKSLSSDLIRGWMPVFRKDMRKSKELDHVPISSNRDVV